VTHDITDVIKNIREIAALPSSGLTGYRKHLVEWANKLEHAVVQREAADAELQKAFAEFRHLFEGA
jgi:hypothetical protein